MVEVAMPPVASRVAQVVAAAVGAFWLVFSVLCGWEDGLVGILIHSLPALAILVAVGLSLRWPVLGGLLLVAEGIVYYLFFGRPTGVVLYGMVLPLLASGAVITVARAQAPWAGGGPA